eukprot:6114084-Pleurochrysis_carterae.AAC.1
MECRSQSLSSSDTAFRYGVLRSAVRSALRSALARTTFLSRFRVFSAFFDSSLLESLSLGG